MEIWGGHGSVFDAVSAPGMDAWVLSRPHDGGERGGDVHYLSGCAAGRVLRVALADVAGHGESVGEVARALRGMMRKSINTPDQSRFVREMNRAFVESSSDGVFATAVVGTYWAPERTLLFVNAGHPRPLLSRNGGAWQALDGAHPDVKRRADDGALSNLPLGVLGETGYEQLALRLDEGDRVLLYTDFAVEARRSDGEELGERGLIRLLDEIAAQDAEFLPELLRRIGDHRGGESAADDATLVLLRHNDSPMPRQSLGDKARTLARLIGLAPV